MKRFIVIILVIGVIGMVALAHKRGRSNRADTPPPDVHSNEVVPPRVVIRDTHVAVDVVDTPELRTQGLSGRASLARGSGMLFVFDTSDTYGFWMKDMRFSIDIIWLDSDGVVVHIVTDAQPASFPKIFTPSTSARYVLEVNAGFVNEHNVHVGDRATFYI